MQRPGMQRCAEVRCAEVRCAEAGHAQAGCAGNGERGLGRRGFWEPRPGEERRLPQALLPVGLGTVSSGDAETPGVGLWSGPRRRKNNGRGRNPTMAELWQGAGDGELRPGLCLRVCPRAHSACAHRQRQAHKGPSGAPLPPQPPAAPAPPPRPSWPRPRAGPGPLRWLAAPLGPLAHPAPQCPWYPDPGRPPFCHLEPKRWPRGLSASL